MVKEHDAHKKEQESLFNKRSEVQKDRGRILEEKFKEAQKNVDKTKDIPLRDIDLDWYYKKFNILQPSHRKLVLPQWAILLIFFHGQTCDWYA